MTSQPRSTDAVLGGRYRRTAKYTAALEVAALLDFNTVNVSQENLYDALNRANYYWNSDSKTWTVNNIPANPASGTIKVRLIASGDTVQHVADDLIRTYTQILDYKLISISKPYPRRPPEQNDSSIYLVFAAS